MTMGVGAALMEHLVVDKRVGFFVNHDLASYEVPVHADIPHQEVIFLDDEDPTLSPMKAMGVGELGICGVAGGGGECHLQRHRRARARVSDHARQADQETSGDPERVASRRFAAPYTVSPMAKAAYTANSAFFESCASKPGCSRRGVNR